jgi:hypothetical protein
MRKAGPGLVRDQRSTDNDQLMCGEPLKTHVSFLETPGTHGIVERVLVNRLLRYI